jgi:hypothetical protein
MGNIIYSGKNRLNTIRSVVFIIIRPFSITARHPSPSYIKNSLLAAAVYLPGQLSDRWEPGISQVSIRYRAVISRISVRCRSGIGQTLIKYVARMWPYPVTTPAGAWLQPRQLEGTVGAAWQRSAALTVPPK